MEDSIPLGPQPDFNHLGQLLSSAGNEIQKARNLPAVATGERILVELQEVKQDVQQMGQNIQRMEQNLYRSIQQMGQTIRQEIATIMITRSALSLTFSNITIPILQ